VLGRGCTHGVFFHDVEYHKPRHDGDPSSRGGKRRRVKGQLGCPSTHLFRLAHDLPGRWGAGKVIWEKT